MSLSKKASGLFRQSLRLAAAHSMSVTDVHFARLQAEMCFPSRACRSGKQVSFYFVASRQNSTRFFVSLMGPAAFAAGPFQSVEEPPKSPLLEEDAPVRTPGRRD